MPINSWESSSPQGGATHANFFAEELSEGEDIGLLREVNNSSIVLECLRHNQKHIVFLHFPDRGNRDLFIHRGQEHRATTLLHRYLFPTREELIDFGRRVRGVSQPARTLQTIAEAMRATLEAAQIDERVPAELLAKMRGVWEDGMGYGR